MQRQILIYITDKECMSKFEIIVYHFVKNVTKSEQNS